MFSIAAKGYCTGFESVLLVYRSESVAHRYVLKGNKATGSIYRGLRHMQDGLSLAVDVAGSWR